MVKTRSRSNSREPSPVRDAGGNVIDINKEKPAKKVKLNEDATKDATKDAKSVASQLKDNG
jgi:hypothetical protein